MFKKFRTAKAIDRLVDERLFELALEEIEVNEIRKGIWAKALSQSNGNMDVAKSLYIKLRVDAMKDEATITEALQEEISQREEKQAKQKKYDDLYKKQTQQANHDAEQAARIKEEADTKQFEQEKANALENYPNKSKDVRWPIGKSAIDIGYQYVTTQSFSELNGKVQTINLYAQNNSLTTDEVHFLVSTGELVGYSRSGDLFIRIR